MTEPYRLIEVGVVGAAHGVRGEVRVKSYTADPTALGRYGPLTDEAGARFVVLSLRPLKADMVAARFEGISSREAAEALNGRKLFVPRDALPDDGDEDEFYHADLIGLAVERPDGERIGVVAAVQNFGADDLLEVRLEGGRRTALIPFTKAVVPTVDVRGGRVIADWSEDDAPGEV